MVLSIPQSYIPQKINPTMAARQQKHVIFISITIVTIIIFSVIAVVTRRKKADRGAGGSSSAEDAAVGIVPISPEHTENKTSIAPGSSLTGSMAITKENNRQVCFSSLRLADVNSDSLLSASEYVAYLNNYLQSSDPGKTFNGYFELPDNMKMLFFRMACWCPENDPNCCSDHLEIHLGDNEEHMEEICTHAISL